MFRSFKSNERFQINPILKLKRTNSKIFGTGISLDNSKSWAIIQFKTLNLGSKLPLLGLAKNGGFGKVI